jgi:hypothetical protein
MVRIFFIFFLSLTAIINVNAQENISLITPYDTDTIDTKYPLFSWFYMSPNFGNNRSYYRIIIVELKKEQSAEAGIVVNSPLVKMDHLNGTQLIYPYDAKELEYGHRYGWQIQRIQDNVIADKSEAWEFTLFLPIVPQQYKYATLNTKGDGVVYLAEEGKVYFKMDYKYFSNELEYYIYNENREIVNVDIIEDRNTDEKVSAAKIIKKNGGNFYEIDLGKGAKPGNYKLIVLDARKNEYSLNFQIN